MFGRGFRIFSIFGIPVHLDISFFIIVPLFALLIARSIPVYAQWTGVTDAAFEFFEITPLTAEGEPTGTGQRPVRYDVGRPGAAFLFGLALTLGLYVSVLIHEFGHALTARAYGVKTERVTLWFLGGIAGFERMPTQPGGEAVVAIVGPITSYAVAGVLWVLAVVSSEGATLWQLAVQSLAVINVFLATFNLLPALPLDGGRVLRSLLALGMPYIRATQISGAISKTLALLLGLAAFLAGNLILVAIAVFIWLAVNAETQQSYIEDLLRDVHVDEVMVRDVMTVPPDLPAGELLQEMIRRRHLGFPVVDEAGRVLGIVGLRDLPEGFDPNQPVSAIMRTDICRQPAGATAQDAFDQMGRQGFPRCVVTDEQGMLQGLLTKADLIRLIQVRSIHPGGAAAGTQGTAFPPRGLER